MGAYEKLWIEASEKYPPKPEVSQRDKNAHHAPAYFAAGWYLGVTSIDKRYEIFACMERRDDLTNDLYDAMGAYISGNSEIGDQKMKESKTLWQTAMANCG